MDSLSVLESHNTSMCLYEQKTFSSFLSVVLVAFIPFAKFPIKKKLLGPGLHVP